MGMTPQQIHSLRMEFYPFKRKRRPSYITVLERKKKREAINYRKHFNKLKREKLIRPLKTVNKPEVHHG